MDGMKAWRRRNRSRPVLSGESMREDKVVRNGAAGSSLQAWVNVRRVSVSASFESVSQSAMLSGE